MKVTEFLIIKHSLPSLREANNSRNVAELVKKSGIKIEIIDGRKERIISNSKISNFLNSQNPFVDVGGSTSSHL